MIGLKYVSWGDNTGYATAAKAYIRALAERNVPVTWTPMLPGRELYEPLAVTEWPDQVLGAVCNKPISYDTVLVHTVPEYFPQFVASARADGKRILGYTVWELDELPTHWPAILNTLDGVIVPTKWNATVFRNSGVRVPVHIVPHLSQFEGREQASAAERDAMLSRLQGDLRDDTFLVYSIGQWSHRKAPYLALEAYWRAFTRGDPVALVIKTSKNDVTQWRRHWRNGFRRRHPDPAWAVAERIRRDKKLAPVIVVSDETLSDGEILALHERGDCFISLARAEGWGLGAFDAARLGKPIVTTGYGGHTDYLDERSTFIVDNERVPIDEPAWTSYASKFEWAEPNVEHAARHLRAIYLDRDKAACLGRQQADRIRRDFSTDAVAAALVSALS